jgi:hypothetical protein
MLSIVEPLEQGVLLQGNGLLIRQPNSKVIRDFGPLIRGNGRVTDFSPRDDARVRSTPVGNAADFAERVESEVDYRHRIRMNLCAAVAVVALMTIGFWLVNSMVDGQKARGCYGSGARFCSLL